MMDNPLDDRKGRRLRAARIAAGLTMRDVASSAEIPNHSILVRYKHGIAREPLGRLAALASAYDTTLAATLAERDEAVTLIGVIVSKPARRRPSTCDGP